ncbi:FadR family transcriptional regulator [Streptomyces sp. NBC_00237]|uniref:FadR/GntR family transcriptional regulator n=1 Tax=Streptomyces sp. NBC_00237 TaxID=2975687 RepID=UPI002257AED9|nr:FadR/GntR family transcriptional regulator [Streptomyces sp. NBC_00237]MCX5201375.1 FadR family transcriptional regulator [Streptomyces sp. NBC_00237]
MATSTPEATPEPESDAAPLKGGSVTQRAIEAIKSMITDGELAPGQRLPTERDLAVLLGISRSSMREAIRALTVLGVLESRHGSGIYVTSLEAVDLLDTFGIVAEISPQPRLVEFLEVRRILESAATALAAARINHSQLADVAVHLAAMQETDDTEAFLAADMAFHRTITHAAGNEALAAIVEGLSSRTFRARVRRGHQEADAFARTREDHARIYQALVSRDPEAARVAAASHVGAVEDWLRGQLDE